jgi:uncharacterized protein
MAYALITGASGGIGKQIAFGLARRNYDLLLVSRNEKLLAENAAELSTRHNIKAHYFMCDLSEPGSFKQVVEWRATHDFPLAILVNNAGYGMHGTFANLPLDGQLNMMHLNMITPIQLTHELIPVLMKNTGKSFIMNVGSTAAYQAVPYLGIYSASKAFILSYSRALYHELKNTNISVTCLCPGSTDTQFIERSGMNKSAKIRKEAERFNMSAEVVAEAGIQGMLAGKAEIIPGLMNKIGAYAASYVPKKIVEKVAKGIYESEEFKELRFKI